MPRHFALLAVICLLLVACYPAETPVATDSVTLLALGEETEVSLFRDPLAPLPDEVGRVPSGSECGLLGSTSWERGHGNETVTLYKVDCSGTVGWVGEASVVFGPEP